MGKQVQVLVDCPGMDRLLTYSIPEDLAVKVGDILTVPFGDRYVGAIAIDLDINESQADFELKPIYAVVNTGLFPPYYWDILIRTADYYRTSLIQTVKAALPPKLLDQSSYRIQINRESAPQGLSTAAQAVWDFLLAHYTPSHKGTISRRFIYQKLPKHASSGLKVLLARGCISTYLEPPAIAKPKYENVVTLLLSLFTHDQVTTRQKEILSVLQRAGGELLQSELISQAQTTVSSLKTMADKGYIAIQPRECLRLGGKNHLVAADRPKNLTTDQTAALETITALQDQAATVLLHGVTGSGKTEVYLQAIAPILAAGKSALVLVPEIGLTPQLTDRFRARFGDRVVNVYHSKLSDGERFDTWRQMLSPHPQILIGTRSAVFAPLPNLGIIILDEEHDSSFKQDQPQPCYHARTVATWRSQWSECPLILGTATPSADTIHAVSQGQIRSVALPQRIGNKPMPPIRVVDMREELKASHWSIFSRELQKAIAEMQVQKKQGILFIHRRGHSTFVSCRSCGYVMDCPRCDVSLSYHHADHAKTSPNAHGNLICHYCNYSQIKPPNCPTCGSPYFKHFGSGTQKVEQEIALLFPELRIIRYDSDTTRNKNQHHQLIEKFQSGEADLLIGTQMLTKGLDIPQVTLVGVISADGLLNFSDFRASERAFQTLLQVAGRAGRGDDDGTVVIQTYTPEHPVIQAVQSYQGDEFMTSELETRAVLNYPPIGQMALIHLSSENPTTVETIAIALSEYLRSLASLNQDPPKWEVLGAAPASITKVNNRYRWQILLKFDHEFLADIPSLEELRAVMSSQVNFKAIRMAIDIDPLTIL